MLSMTVKQLAASLLDTPVFKTNDSVDDTAVYLLLNNSLDYL